MTDTPQKPSNLGAAWCSQHKEHPDACFEKHRPDVKQVQGSPTADQHRGAIMKEHIKRQIKNEEAAPEEVKITAHNAASSEATIVVEDDNAQ